MGHKQSKAKGQKGAVDPPEETAEERKIRLQQKEKEFYQLADEIIAAAKALKDHFSSPVDDSLVAEYDAIREKMSQVKPLLRTLDRERYPLDDRAAILMYFGYVFNIDHFPQGPPPENTNGVPILDDIARELEMRSQELRAQKDRERRNHLFDAFEAAYKNNNGSSTEKELDEAYSAVIKAVDSYVEDSFIGSCYRNGTFAIAFEYDRRFDAIMEDFKKKFPDYTPSHLRNKK